MSDFSGTVPYHWVSLFTDPSQKEVYVAGSSDRSVRIFSRKGMQVYSFGEDSAFGGILDGAVHPDGDIFVLSYDNQRTSVIRSNYRGEPESRIELKNLPPEFEKIVPNRIAYREGHLYLADKGAMKVVVVNEKGMFEKGIDLLPLLGVEEKKRADMGLVGFNVDEASNILFTVPVLFSAYKLAPDGTLTGFGEAGQTQGKFGVVAGIVSDGHGNILVADTLRCVVMIFTDKLKFQSEFGYRGVLPGNLVAPMDLAFDQDRLFVAQGAFRGVSVFQMKYE